MKTEKQNRLSAVGLYTLGVYIVLIPFKLWILSISISIILGFFFGLMNEIILQLKKINGEVFFNDDEKKVL